MTDDLVVVCVNESRGVVTSTSKDSTFWLTCMTCMTTQRLKLNHGKIQKNHQVDWNTVISFVNGGARHLSHILLHEYGWEILKLIRNICPRTITYKTGLAGRIL